MSLAMNGMRAVLIALACSTTARGQNIIAEFDRLDRESRMLITTLRCAGATAQIAASGSLGKPESLGNRGACVAIGAYRYGVLIETDSAVTRAIRFNVVDFGTRARYPGAVDTNSVLATLRAQDDALERGYPAFEKANRQFTPMTFRTDGDSIAVWLIPVEVLNAAAPMVGGERGYLYAPDGRKLAREMDSFNTLRRLPATGSGTITIVSSGDSMPTMTEMFIANALNASGRAVSIETKSRVSTLTTQSNGTAWIHVRKP